MNFIYDPSLVLYLPLHKLDGGSFMSGDAYGHVCTVTGATWGFQGRYFDGNDDYINVGAKISPSSGGRSYGLWIKIPAVSANNCLFDECNYAKANNGHTFALDASGGLYAYHAAAAGTANFNTGDVSATEVDDDVWHNVWFTWDGLTTVNGVSVYIDGALDVQNTANAAATNAPTFDMQIGAGATQQNDLTGIIGEVVGYNRALNALEIQRNYMATKWRYR
ncbi:LamG domain-containing protein [Chloroflexota bacterium]